ncbi:hypoxanthine phosphoribosyltransferase [Caldithrix abyssi]|uniref:Hypoxanthine phosphoribosyltransferase n=1 Tax=Caldithrix abyssi DSM 13497 TaxID=880073 RepID=H1XNZ8_CALAY|nr:hypoxanthine phosphoribosyltransferase [Caldithrix abyssi]APF20487.1 hypoxanthine phosphoribosyltransferase [Caldithrix abyssi DSM 13497]EHO40990.1 hypoxanthine phosphoribosyltransferase [Caldithrix abyssi DSM 13497]
MKRTFNDQSEIVPENYHILIPEATIESRLKELGQQISRDFRGKKPILIGILNGSFIFLADLIRNLDIDVEVDFLRISSYGDGRESSGHIKILKPLSADINGRSVIVVEDIVDSGLSVQFLERMLSAFNPVELKFVTLLNKPSKNIVEVHIDYIGFEIEDKFVVGYGLDDAQLKRNLRSIYFIE